MQSRHAYRLPDDDAVFARRLSGGGGSPRRIGDLPAAVAPGWTPAEAILCGFATPLTHDAAVAGASFSARDINPSVYFFKNGL